MNNTSYNVLIGAAVLGLIAGTWGMTQRLLYGLNPVAFGSYVPWGLWVAFYLFFLGLSAGAFLVTTMTYVSRMERFRVIARLSAFTVLICLLCEVLFITLDLGRMARIYRFLITPSFSSLMTWMFVLFNAMLVIYALKTFFLVRGDLVSWANDETRKGSKWYRLLALGRTDYGETNQERDQHPSPPSLGHQSACWTAVLRHQRSLFRHSNEPPHLEQCSHPPVFHHGCRSSRWCSDYFPWSICSCMMMS